MVKSSDYTRDLSEHEIKLLKAKHSHFLKRSRRNGFLPTETKKRLLRITNWKRGTSNQEIYQFFSEIREHALTALMDFQLLCETLNEKELERVFTKKESFEHQNKKIETTRYPITELMELLFPHPIFARKQTKPFMEQYMKERHWRKNILEDLMIEALTWYFHSGLMRTTAQKQMLFNVIDAIEVNSSGKKTHELTYVRGEMEIVKF